MRRCLGLLAVLAAVLLLLALSAGQALASTVHCGDLITHDVKLDADLTGCSGDGLVVGAANITIDLNGHTIAGSGTGFGIRNASIPTDPYEYPASDYVGVTVEKGTIRGFGQAIYNVADGQSFRRLTVDGEIDACCFGRHYYIEPNGDRLLSSHVTGRVSVGRTAAVEDNRIEGGLGIGSGRVARNLIKGGLGQFGGFVARNGPLVIERNAIFDSLGYGIGLAGSVGTRIERNAVYANHGGGLGLFPESGIIGAGTSYSITQNRIYSNGGDGIRIAGPVCEQVSKNRIFGNGGDGINANYGGNDYTPELPYPGASGACAPAHRFLHNSLSLNGGDGLYAVNYHSPLLVQDNSADRNRGDGLHVGRGAIGNTNPSWSPDATHIAFQSGSSDIFTAKFDGTDAKRLTSDPAQDTNPRWSPDGATIAFESTRSGSLALYAMNPDGSGVRKLADLPSGDRGFSWSPDGTRIAFAADYLYVVNADGTGLRRVTYVASPLGPVWSPSGTQIAFEAGDVHWLYVVNADGSDVTQLSLFPDHLDAVWSPDGAKIAVNGITTLNLDGSDLPFGTDITPGSHPQWAPDSKRLTFDSKDRGSSLSDVFVANANGSGRINVTKSAASAETRPVWSPDGSRIAFTLGLGINEEIATIRPDGSGRTSIVNDFPATLTSNSANRNGALGIDTVAGVTDGGGNSASQNGDPRQCLNIACDAAGKQKKG